MTTFLMQARSSDDGELYAWVVEDAPDWAAAGFPGPGTAEYTAVAKRVGAGLQGPPGPAGSSGAGTHGRRGAAGLDGFDGTPGRPGIPGAPGADGAGFPGQRGAAGLDGFDGLRGRPGAPGADGFGGPSGRRGGTGFDGFDGMPGRAGVPGLVGADGSPGRRGGTGLDGFDGMPGRHGIPGTIGSMGPHGRTGRPGFDGLDGSLGRPGAPGMPGAIGPAGQHGVGGLDGLPGTQGRPGPPGPPAALFDSPNSYVFSTAPVNNWDPGAGSENYDVWRITNAFFGGNVLSGIAASRLERPKLLVNVSGNHFYLAHNQGASTAANRFYLAQSFVLVRDGDAVLLWYDKDSSRIRVSQQAWNVFSATERGVVEASGGGTTNFLRADGWNPLPGFGGALTVADYTFSGSHTHWTDTGSAAADVWRIQCTGQPRALNSINSANFAANKLKQLTVIGTYPLILVHEESTSSTTAAYRLSLPQASDRAVYPGQSVFLWYNTLDSRVVVVATDQENILAEDFGVHPSRSPAANSTALARAIAAASASTARRRRVILPDAAFSVDSQIALGSVEDLELVGGPRTHITSTYAGGDLVTGTGARVKHIRYQLTGSALPTDATGIFIGGPDQEVRSCKVSTNQRGLEVNAVANVRIVDTTADGTTFGLLAFNSGCSNLRIDGSTLTSGSGEGVRFQEVTGAKLTRSTVFGAQYGVRVRSASSDIQLHGNTVGSEDTTGNYDGVYLESSDGCSVLGNTVVGSGSNRSGVRISSSNVVNTVIDDNTIRDNGGAPIYVTVGTTGLVIGDGNTYANNGSIGIQYSGYWPVVSGVLTLPGRIPQPIPVSSTGDVDCVTINGLLDGQRALLYQQDDSPDVTWKHLGSGGNIWLAGEIDHKPGVNEIVLEFIKHGSFVKEITRFGLTSARALISALLPEAEFSNSTLTLASGNMIAWIEDHDPANAFTLESSGTMIRVLEAGRYDVTATLHWKSKENVLGAEEISFRLRKEATILDNTTMVENSTWANEERLTVLHRRVNIATPASERINVYMLEITAGTESVDLNGLTCTLQIRRVP